jgi:hypothetical protein
MTTKLWKTLNNWEKPPVRLMGPGCIGWNSSNGMVKIRHTTVLRFSSVGHRTRKPAWAAQAQIRHTELPSRCSIWSFFWVHNGIAIIKWLMQFVVFDTIKADHVLWSAVSLRSTCGSKRAGLLKYLDSSRLGVLTTITTRKSRSSKHHKFAIVSGSKSKYSLLVSQVTYKSRVTISPVPSS